MAKVVSIRKHALLPFPEQTMRRGERSTVSSEPAMGLRFHMEQLIFSDKCRMHLRVRLQDKTSGSWVSADLIERLPCDGFVSPGSAFEMEVECIEDCVFSAAIRGQQELP